MLLGDSFIFSSMWAFILHPMSFYKDNRQYYVFIKENEVTIDDLRLKAYILGKLNFLSI